MVAFELELCEDCWRPVLTRTPACIPSHPLHSSLVQGRLSCSGKRKPRWAAEQTDSSECPPFSTWLLVCHHFIFLTIFLESNKQYEMLYMLYCNLIGFHHAGGGGRRFSLETEAICANCVAGKQQQDCLGVSPDVEALSWLSVPCPSLLSLCVSGAASVSCSAVYSLHRTFPRSNTDTTVQKSIIIILWWW